MRARACLVFAGALLAAWDTSAQPGGPVDAAVKHIEALYAHRCTDAWASFSKATQDRIRNEVHRRERERAGAPLGEKVEEQHCGKSGRLKRGSPRLVSSHGDEATVTLVIIDRISRRRYDYFPPESELTETLRLVREGGAWKVDLPRPHEERALRTLVEIGKVDVFVGHYAPGLHQRLEATMVTRAPRAALDAVLRDPQAWALALPSFRAIEPLERKGDAERVLLTFAEPARPVAFITSMSQPRDPMDQVTRGWNIEHDLQTAPYMRGRWDITSNQDGTARVKLTLVINPQRWPEGHFSAERLGSAVLDLEKAAAERSGRSSVEEVKLIGESGPRKADVPGPKGPAPLLKVGQVRVSIRPPPEPGKLLILEATANSKVDRDALEAVLRDPKGWAAVLPSFMAIEPGEQVGPLGKAELTFAPPSVPIPIRVQRAGKPNNPKVPFTTLIWYAEGEHKAPVYMRGEWYLTPNGDEGTRVKLTIVLDPRHWPASERLFSPERMANALLDLEKVAVKR